MAFPITDFLMDTGIDLDPDLTIVLLGKTGVGKSASGNTILGRQAFESRLSFKPVTSEISTKTGNVFGKKIKVVDTPGISEDNARDVNVVCQDILRSSRPCLFLVVVKIDRFTREDEEAVRLAMEALGPEGLEKAYLLFTGGDTLKKMSLDEFIFEVDEGLLPNIVKKMSGAYHSFNNENEDQEQVRDLLLKSGHLGTCDVEPVLLEERRIVLLGLPGAGKSSSGNTILGSERFRSVCGFNPVTSECVSESAIVQGHQVTVVDTPGFTDKILTPEKLYKEIMKTLVKANPGPHAFVIVVKIDRVTEAEIKMFELLPHLFGSDVLQYTMVLFTHGDDMKGQSIDELIKSTSCVSKLVSMCGGRYCVFENTERGNRRQVQNLLDKINEIVAHNDGKHCTSEMFRVAQTFIREEMNRSNLSHESNPSGSTHGANRTEHDTVIKRAWKRLMRFLMECWKKICEIFNLNFQFVRYAQVCI